MLDYKLLINSIKVFFVIYIKLNYFSWISMFDG